MTVLSDQLSVIGEPAKCNGTRSAVFGRWLEDRENHMSVRDNRNASYLGKVSNFFSPSKIALGVDAAKSVGMEAKALGAEKALIVTDPGVVKAGLVEGIREALIDEKVRVVGVYDKVEVETPARVIDEAAAMARAGGFELIVGLGVAQPSTRQRGSRCSPRTRGVCSTTWAWTSPRRRRFPRFRYRLPQEAVPRSPGSLP